MISCLLVFDDNDVGKIATRMARIGVEGQDRNQHQEERTDVRGTSVLYGRQSTVTGSCKRKGVDPANPAQLLSRGVLLPILPVNHILDSQLLSGAPGPVLSLLHI